MLKAKIQNYEVEISMGLLLAGLPADRKALEFLASHHPEKDGGLAAKTLLEETAGEEEYPTEEVQRGKCIFRRTPETKRPAIDEHHIRAFVRDTLIKLDVNRKAPWRGFWKDIYTSPLLIPIAGEEVIETRAFKTGFPNYASVVVVHEAVKDAKIRFILEIHGDHEKVDLKDLEYLFAYGGRYVGFGPAKGKSMSEVSYGIFTGFAISVVKEPKKPKSLEREGS